MRLAAVARPAPRIQFTALMAGLAALLALAAHAQPPADGPLKYRRIFVPQDDLESQIEGLLPMNREQFEQRIQQATRQTDDAAAATEARIERANYAARFDGQDLVDGAAELEVVATDGGKKLLSLSTCNLALHNALWEGTDEEDSRPAILGQAADGRPACLVAQSGTLKFAWSARGTSLPGSAVQFALQLPQAASSLLTLDLPLDQRPILEGAIVVGSSPTPAVPADEDADEGDGRVDGRTWQIAVAGSGHALVTIQRIATEREQFLVAVRETSTYSIPGSALDLQSQFALNLFGQEVNQLMLHVERPLEVTAIRLADKSPTWRTLASDEKASTIAVDLGAPFAGEAVLEVDATAPWAVDPPAPLPRMAVVDGVYQEGVATIVAPGWLRIQARPLTGCWQTSIVPAAPGRSTDQLQFQLQSPTAAIELSADSRRPGIRERSGTQITVDSTHVTAVTIAELTPLVSDQYAVEARIPRRWLVDAVDVEPAEAVSDRTLVPGSEAAGQLLRLNLRTPLAESRPLIVTIRARHRRPAGDQSLGERFFRVATFADVQAAERLVALRTVDSGEQFRLLGGERPTRLEPNTLSEQQMRLFESPPGTLLFVDDDDAGGVATELMRAAARYRADLQMEGFLQGTELRESVRVRCVPEASAVGQVVVRLSPNPAPTVKWTIAGQDNIPIEAELLERADGASQKDALYRIQMPSPRSGEFELRGEWTRSLATWYPLTLAYAPEATSQTGLVELHALDASAFTVDADGLQAQLIPTSPPDQFTTLRARYAYQPGRQASPRLTALPARQVAPPALVESLVVRSRFDAGGSGEHEAVLEIENHGLVQLPLRISAAAHEIRQFDPRTGDVSPVVRPSADTITIDLPSGRRHTTVALRYRSTAAPLGWRGASSFSAPLPETDLPVLSRRWFPAIGPELRFADPARDKFAADAAIANDPAFRGWSASALELPAGNVASLEVYRLAVMQALAIGLALFAAALAYWIRRPAILLGCAVLLLAASALAGPVAELLMQGVAAGFVAGAVVMLLFTPSVSRRAPLLATPAHDSTRSRVREFAAWLLLAGAGWLAWSGPAFSQNAPAAPANGRPVEQRVIIPVDAEQQPTGDYVYLTPELYERLHKLGDSAAKLPDWIITAAHYQLPAVPSVAGDSFTIDQVRARFEVETFQAATVLELPLQRDQVLLLEGQARLDGVGVTLSWRDDGAALRVPIQQAGSHRLELAFGAQAKKVDGGALLDVRIPVVSNSTVSIPAGAARSATIVSAQGSGQAGEPAETWTALGPAQKLSVLWPPPEGAQAAARLEAEQLLWWKLRPGSVVVEGKFRFRPLGGAVQRFSIAVDPRLRLLPGSVAPAAARTWVEEGSPAIVHLELAESTSSEITVSASWLWVGVSGTGNLLLPPIQANGDRLVRSWRAVSAEPPLVVAAERPAASALKPEDFLIAWSEPATEPALASDELMGGPAVAVVAAPAASKPEAATAADWSFSGQNANLRFSANLSQVSPSHFQHRLELPPLLKVSRVEIVAAGASLPLRWDQRANGSLVVTLLAPPPAEHQLVLEAQARLGDRARWTLPAVEIEGATLSQQLCRFYRHSDVQVRLQNAAGWNVEEASLAGLRTEGLGRLVAALRSEGVAAKPPSVQLSSSRPAVSGRLALRMFEDDGAWSAEADLSLHVGGGVLDAIRLELPDEWSGPFEINPAVEHRLQPLVGTSRRELWIWPQQPVAEQARFTLRAPLKTTGGPPVRAPVIRLPEVESLERLLVLDTRFGTEALQWETSGLEAVSSAGLPPEWTASGEDVYRVVSEQFAASPLTTANVKRTPRVRLSEIWLAAQPAGRAVGRAAFFIDPAGATELQLTMPPNSRLAGLTIDGQAAQCRAAGLRSWQVAMPSPRMPLLLEVVYDAALPTDDGQQSQTLIAPQLAGLTPDLTAWRLAGLAPTVLAAKQQITSDVDAELVWLEACAAAVAQLAVTPAGDLPAENLAFSWRAWTMQLRSSEERLAAIPEEQRGQMADVAARLKAIKDRAADAEQKLIQAGVLTPAAAADVPVVETSPLWRDQALSVAVIAREPDTGRLRVRRSDESPDPARPRWTMALGIAALGFAGWTLVRSRVAHSWLAEHAHLVLALTGLTWWLFAPLPWLGWLAVALAVWLALRLPWSLRRQTFS